VARNPEISENDSGPGNIPELLAPAGCLMRLRVAVRYGADAIYVGGQKYGLRARADNFTDHELREGVAFARDHGVKVYVTLNAVLHDSDMDGLADYCRRLEEIGVWAVIVSDLGVLRTVRQSSGLRVHLSTQASCLNTGAAQFYKAQGVDRIVLGRELSLPEASRIAEQAGLEVEVFGHGAMCMSYSGNCTISNFTAGRDSNRGGCAHSCRFDYEQTQLGSVPGQAVRKSQTAQFMSSRDLMAIGQLGDFCRLGIHSLKIEGRMKSAFYVATVTRAYREVLDAIAAGSLDEALLARVQRDLQAVPHRDYFSGNLAERAGSDSVFEHEVDTPTIGSHHYLGVALETRGPYLALRLTAPIEDGEEVEWLPSRGDALPWRVRGMEQLDGTPIAQARQDSVIRVALADLPAGVEALMVLRGRMEACTV
jgi:putative protease